jgi:hypothetical protein
MNFFFIHHYPIETKIEGKMERRKRNKIQQSIIDIFAGTLSGINVTLVGHPFDTLKIRLQTQPTNNPIYSGLKGKIFFI